MSQKRGEKTSSNERETTKSKRKKVITQISMELKLLRTKYLLLCSKLKQKWPKKQRTNRVSEIDYLSPEIQESKRILSRSKLRRVKGCFGSPKSPLFLLEMGGHRAVEETQSFFTSQTIVLQTPVYKIVLNVNEALILLVQVSWCVFRL